ncbi:M23 family peptidase [Helicobacter sp. MIT 14-3879]|nr:M23 family peptidase [Helicobacter sp. MIT 14-3879]
MIDFSLQSLSNNSQVRDSWQWQPESSIHSSPRIKSTPEVKPYQENIITREDFKRAIDGNNTDLINKNLASKDSSHVKRINQQENIVFVDNGRTYIAVNDEKNPKPLQVGKKTLQWLKHPKDKTKKIAFIPIHYYEQDGDFMLHNGLILRIKRGNYKKEKIIIADSSKVQPNKAANERIQKELAEANQVYRTYTPTRYWSTPFIYPIKSVVTSPFGSARVFNNEIKSYHSGTDFRAAIGTPLRASNDGVVVIAKERFLAGKSVVISHGEGVFSQYYHCSKIKVKTGDKVKKGDIIALSGDTGRVSAAHLHFGFIVNGVSVDPLQFIEEVNKLFN